MLDVDLWSVIHAVRAFVPRMLEQAEGGHIVNTASMSGLLPIPNLAAYSVAKSAVVALSEALQLDLDAEGASIGVSVLCPGFIATRITESERNRPAELTDDGAGARRWPARRPVSQATMDAAEVAGHVVDAIRTEPLLDPDPRRLPGGDPAARRRDRDRRPPGGATDLVTAPDGRRQVPASRDDDRAPSGRCRRSGTGRS